MTKLYIALAQELARRDNLKENRLGVYPPDAWRQVRDDIRKFVRKTLPSGSGFDIGTVIDESSTPERLIFSTSYHHRDASGGYCGWSAHQIIVIPSLQSGFNLRITGRNRDGVKEYVQDVFSSILESEIKPCSISPVRSPASEIKP